ncbi:MAG: SpaA isopeptide-forming pilin-related protein, partial [Methanothrix sp.]|nr:SpaA isopeptide-forming pilin-related protein [Methanothrix sp.]
TQVGTSQILVQVKDDQHAGPEGENGNRSAEFTINAPAPEIVVPAPLNESPSLSSLVANKTSPQLAGTVITWTAEASDAENDPMLYRFLLNGTPATDWQSQNQWAWTATQVGTSQILVQVKDDQHAGPEGENGNRSAEFTINAPAPENITVPVAPAPAAENQTPVLNALMPDKPSPQTPGTSITWTANATDADNDPVLFRFFLNGPATAGSWQPETDWSSANTWTWTASLADAGQNQVRVWARDGKHAAEDGFDSEQTAIFSLVEPSRNISGMKFNDKNGNGLKDSGEPGLAGWIINLVKPDGSGVSTITKEDGSYRFESLNAGTYTVNEVAQSGWNQTVPTGSYVVDLKDTDAIDKDFGNRLTTYTISGMKFNDLNSNGANDGEPGLEGWTIKLTKPEGTQATATTSADGSYKFENLAPGSYTVAEVEQSGWTGTAPKEGSYSVQLKDADVSGKDFGNHGAWAISGTKFHDLNGNGARDGDEPGLASWNIQLSKDGNVINATATGQDGSYAFKNLAPGTYTLSEVAQDGWIQTAPQGSYTVELKDADATGKDFGNRGNLSISGVKFYDANGNGAQDSDEPGIPGQTVKLMQSGKEIATATSGQDGSYAFNNLAPGTYEVDDPIIVSVTITSVIVAPIPISGSYSISGVKFNDINGNGVKDPGEPGIVNWGIDLVLAVPGPDLLLAQVQTDASGAYSFDHLFPGAYQVKELAKQGWTPTTPTELAVNIPGSSANQNFGNRVVMPPGLASIWGIKFDDLNNNGVNNGEPGLAGWTIQLRNASTSALIGTTTTDASGWYNFSNLQPGGYTVSEVAQSGWTQTAPAGGSYTFTLAADQTKLGVDFGNHNNNLPPTNPTLVSNRPSPQRAGTPIIWTAGATDPEVDPLQFRFFVRGPSPSPALRADTGYSANSVWTWSTVGYAPGTYQVEVWIRDGLHAGPNSYDVKKTVSFTLGSANLPPVVKVLFADRPAPQFAGSWIKWTALAFDPEGDPLQYRFFLRSPSTGGFWMDQTGWGRNNRWIWRTTPFDVGFSEVLVAVRDGKHAGPAGSDDYAFDDYFIINLNQPPVITSLATSAPSPQPVGATIRWAAVAIDPENNPVFFRYWLKGPSTRGLWKLVRDWSTDPAWTWPTSPADAGTSEVQVQVRDGFHASPAGWDDDAGALFTVLRPNLPPKLTALLPDKPSPQYAGTLLMWTASAADPDKDPIFYRFWLKGPSTGNTWKIVQDWSTKKQWIWASAPADAGGYNVYVYARDGKHAPATGYDSAVGQTYRLQNPLIEKRLTTGRAAGAMPSLAFTGEGYLLAYQSWELGLGGQGDVVLQKFDPAWNRQKSVWVASSKANESAPALASSGGYYYVAYVSTETGSRDIFVKRYDSTLKLLDARRLTNSPTNQDSPSLIAGGNNFYLAYQSWDTGTDQGGDIFLTRYDQNWKPLATAQLTDQRSYQDRPSLAYAEGSIYLAYVSRETGNLDIFQKRLDGNLKVLETRRIASDRSDQDYPSLKWLNGQFMLLYASKKTGNYEIMLDRYLRDGKPIDSTVAVAALGDQTASSLAFSTVDGMYWVAYASRDASGQNIYVKPLKLASPGSLQPCDIVTSFGATRAGSPYTLTVKFYNNYGALADPTDLTFAWSPQDAARQGDQLQRISTGTFQLRSVFGAKGDKSFRIGANIDGCISAKTVAVKVT